MTSNPETRSRAVQLTRVLAAGGVAVAAFTLAQRRSADGREPRLAFTTYLREHLAGADAAIAVVGRLKDSEAGGEERTLFLSLFEAFQEDRKVVSNLLRELGGSPMSGKRLASRAAGTLLKAVAGGKRGDLSLFRTLEALAIAVQGKRCLWRAARAMSWLPTPWPRNFIELELNAVAQWEAIERRRKALVLRTFGR